MERSASREPLSSSVIRIEYAFSVCFMPHTSAQSRSHGWSAAVSTRCSPRRRSEGSKANGVPRPGGSPVLVIKHEIIEDYGREKSKARYGFSAAACQKLGEPVNLTEAGGGPGGRGCCRAGV